MIIWGRDYKMTLELYVMRDENFTFWKKKGEQAWSRDVVRFAEEINKNKEDFIIKLGNDYRP
jgi:hypothetical protein